MRVVRTPDGRVLVDETGRLAGRGAYLCRDAACHERALAKGVLPRALGVPLTAEVREALDVVARAAPTGAGTRDQMTDEMTESSDEGGAGGQE